MVTATILDRDAAAMSDADLYDYDFPAWCERQADHLRALSTVPSMSTAVDWPHVIEEIEDMGRALGQQVEGLLTQAMLHLLKLQGDPAGTDLTHWAGEIRMFLIDAQRRYAPSMRQRIDLDALWTNANFALSDRRTRTRCPLTLDALLAPFPDVTALLAKLPPP